MKKILIGIVALGTAVGLYCASALTLTDIPNEAAAWTIKSTVNSNNTLIELADAAMTVAYTAADVVISNGLVAYANAKDTIISNGVTAAFQAADLVYSNGLVANMTARDTIISNGVTAAFQAADLVYSNGLVANMDAKDTIISNGVSAAFAAADIVISNGVSAAFAAADTVISNGAVWAANAGVLNNIILATTAASDMSTSATITVTCTDRNGSALTSAETIEFWFTTSAVKTVPDTNGMASFTFTAHGSVLDYTYDGTEVKRYLGLTHTDGTMDFVVLATNQAVTNNFVVYAPQIGLYTNIAVCYTNVP